MIVPPVENIQTEQHCTNMLVKVLARCKRVYFCEAFLSYGKINDFSKVLAQALCTN